MPVLYGQKINVFKLYSAVVKRGGYEVVTEEKRWKEVGRLVCAKHNQITNLSFLVRVAYERSLLDFEKYVEKCCEYLKLDTSHLDALTDACDAEDGATSDSGTAVKVELMESPTKRPRAGSQGGEETELAALDGLIGLTENGASEGAPTPVKREPKDEEEEKPKSGDLLVPKPDDDVDMGMDFIEHMLPKDARVSEEPVNLDEVYCELCGGGAHEDQIILCDKCDKGFHTFCLAPPLESIPAGEWCCPDCIFSATDGLAFTEGSDFTVEEFRKMDSQFQQEWFESKGKTPTPSWWEVEDEFWNIVENSDEPCEVFYGADLDSGRLGSGFPHSRHGHTGQYADSPWNLNNLPKLGGKYCSMLRHVTDNINGVIVPWLYMGMTFSSFCWHVEDHMFYSINYNHVGKPKVWYGVPSHSALKFEEVFRRYMPKQFELQPDLLFQLVTMLSPRILKASSVPVYRVVQEAGSFVITFPRAYHGGFNSGFNCAEAVNFAPADWFDFDQDSVDRYREYRRNPVLSHEALLCKVCETDDSPVTARSVQAHLKELILKEAAARQESHLHAKTCRRVACTSHNPGKGFGDDDAECAICKQYMHLSACTCRCTPNYFVCLECAERMCSCDASQRTLVYRRTLAELEDMYANLLSRVEGCDVARKMSEDFGKYGSETPRRARQAEAWCREAVALLKEGCAPKRAVEDKIDSASKFLWGGHAMDEVRDHVTELEAALEWGREVASCLSAKRRKLQLDFVRGLIGADPKPLDVDLSRLEKWVRDTEGLNETASKVLDSTEAKAFTFDEAQDLLKAANRSLIVMPLLEDLTTAVASAEAWCAEAQGKCPLTTNFLFFSDPLSLPLSPDFLLLGKTKGAKPPFSALASLSKRGQSKLPGWSIRERVLVQEAIEAVESLEREAEEVVLAKPTLKELDAVLSAGSSIPVSVPQLEEVRRRRQVAREWLREIEDGSARGVKDLRKLLHRGERIPVDLETHVVAMKFRIAVQEWTEKMEGALRARFTNIKTMEEVIEEGVGGVDGVDEDSELVVRARTRIRELTEWSARVGRLDTEKSPLDELRAAIAESSRVGGNAAHLQKAVAKRSWEAKVDGLLEKNANWEDWDGYEVALAEGRRSGMDPVRMQALEFRQKCMITKALGLGRKYFFFPTRSWGPKKRRGVRSRKRNRSFLHTTLRVNRQSPAPSFYVSPKVRESFADESVRRELVPLVQFGLKWTCWRSPTL